MDEQSIIGFDPSGKPFPVHAAANPLYGRGALLGLAVGDALGTTLEFTTPAGTAYPTLMEGPHREIIGQGPFRLAAGQVTDDTQMASCLAASLMAQGRLDLDDVATRYLAWQACAFDVGNQTAGALDLIRSGVSADHAGQQLWLSRDRQPAGNGSLMRTVPVGLFFAGQPEPLIEAAMTESAITHFDPRCQLACAGFNAAIAVSVFDLADVRTMATAAVSALDTGAKMLTDRYPEEEKAIASAREALRDDLRAADSNDPGLYRDDLHLHRHAGFVRVAFRLAFWHLLHTESFEAALIDVVNRGGDADTNGAIVGALLGAAHGEDAIPVRWRNAVLNALAEDTSSFGTLYHPRTLLEFVHPR